MKKGGGTWQATFGVIPHDSKMSASSILLQDSMKVHCVNKLYYGDNLDILRRYIDDESVDLIYLDPPFNSKRDYNAVFTSKGGQKSAAQIQAFEDTWRWDDSAARAYDEVVIQGTHTGAAECLKSFRSMLGTNDMLAYLSMMAVRLVELRRVLKSSGSIYLHCDPTMSHYLKVLMDAVFSPRNFRSEITWKRQSAHSDAKHQFANVVDVILFYAKSSESMFNVQYTEHDPIYVENFYRHDDGDERGSYQLADMASPNPRPNLMYNYKGFPCPPKGWRYSLETMQELDADGRIYFPVLPDGTFDYSKRLRLKRYLSEQRGSIVTNLWTDIQSLTHHAAESLGYPTQKPIALLNRIISASSNEGDVMLDPFCGCGTSIAAAQSLGRQWIGIDITHLAVNLMRSRMINTFGDSIHTSFSVVGEPVTVEDAIALAHDDNQKYQFQFWALGLVGARPEASDEKRGADKGIDGKRFFSDQLKGKTKTIIISVKGGKTIPATAVRDLRGTIEREEAEIGVLISIAEPTKNMREDAAAAGFYESPMGSKHRRIQLLTIEQLLEGKTIDMPSSNQTRADVETIKRAHKSQFADKQTGLDL